MVSSFAPRQWLAFLALVALARAQYCFSSSMIEAYGTFNVNPQSADPYPLTRTSTSSPCPSASSCGYTTISSGSVSSPFTVQGFAGSSFTVRVASNPRLIIAGVDGRIRDLYRG